MEPKKGNRDGPPAPSPRELAYVEEVGLYFEQTGLTRMGGRLIGWLLICDPPEQSAADLAEVLRASKGSISTTTRLLVQARLIERVALSGERRDYFRIRPDAWAERLAAAMALVTAFRQLTERGLELVGEEAPGRRDRLEAVHDLYRWLETEMPAFLARWWDERREREAQKEGGR